MIIIIVVIIFYYTDLRCCAEYMNYKDDIQYWHQESGYFKMA